MKALTRKAPLKAGFVGGTLAGAATVAATALGRPVGLVSADEFPPPETWQGMFGGPRPRATALGSALFAVGGGAWGALFAAFVEDPTPLKGALFGVLPLLYEGAAVAPLMGKRPFFGGRALPNALGVVGNCLIWGGSRAGAAGGRLSSPRLRTDRQAGPPFSITRPLHRCPTTR